MPRMRRIKEKENERVIDWMEYLSANSISRPLHPKKEMLTKEGYYDRKAMYYGVVSVRYDVRYVIYWLNKYVLNKLGIDKSELIQIMFNSFTGGLLEIIMNEMLKPFDTSIPGLERTNFAEFFQFLAEESKKGKFWVIAELETERCLFLTDNAEPGRLVLPKTQYIGKNRLKDWRDSMNEYEQLKHLLVTEKVAPSFNFNLYRLDNSFVHFQKTFYLIDNLWGTQCRVSVSEGWELLKPAPNNQ